jgi:hypothetical protein
MAHLTEPGIRNYFVQTLQTCKEAKMTYYTRVVNLGLLVGFVVVLGGVLYYKYKGRVSPDLKKTKMEADRLYILNKIKTVQIDRQKQNNMLITNLPGPESSYFFH